MGSRVEGGFKCVQRDQKDSTCGRLDKRGQYFGAERATHRMECRDLLYAFLVVSNFSPRPTLLAEPEHPAAESRSTVNTYGDNGQERSRTYVCRRGCTTGLPLRLPFAEDLSLLRGFSSPGEEATKVEKCLDEGTRGREAGTELGAVVVWVVVDWGLELARKRDCEWFEK